MENNFICKSAKFIKNDFKFLISAKVLDLGCGDSVLSYSLIRKLNLKILFYHGIDCNSKCFQSNFFYKQNRIKNYSLVVEDMNKLDVERNYDFVISLNSFYALHLKKLKYYLNHLTNNGLFITLLNSQEGLFHKISKFSGITMVSAEDIENFLISFGLQFQSYTLRYKFSAQNNMSDLYWLKYLLGGTELNNFHLNIFNSIEEVEKLIVIQKNV